MGPDGMLGGGGGGGVPFPPPQKKKKLRLVAKTYAQVHAFFVTSYFNPL